MNVFGFQAETIFFLISNQETSENQVIIEIFFINGTSVQNTFDDYFEI